MSQSEITHDSPVATQADLKEFYEDIKPYLGCPAYVTQEGDADYYTTNEKVIGRFIDGKPLYQKIIQLTRPSSLDTWEFTPIGVRVDNVARVEMFTPDSDLGAPLCFTNMLLTSNAVKNTNPATGNGIVISTRTDSWTQDEHKNSIGMMSGNNGWTGTGSWEFYCIIAYTKVEDSAATTVETKPTHYSTDEQVVGEWIDGRPVYQKVITKDHQTMPVNAETIVVNTSSILDKTNIQVIDFHGGYYADWGKAGEQFHQFTGRDGEYGYSAYYRQCDDAIKVYGGWGNLQYTIDNLIFYIRYIKKSDL